jgi:phosphatidylserine decarboxylase
MYLHREGRNILIPAFIILLAVIAVTYATLSGWLLWAIAAVSLVIFLLLAQFFRVPKRTPRAESNEIICPADGKVVVIEEVEEHEYFKDRRIQVSIFMSPLNVHVQWTPMTGVVSYVKYHKGLYLVAWHPKSSTDNERTTMVIRGDKHEVLFRQIAGAVARRIRYYLKKGQQVEIGEECGFIKFGSRVDVFLPIGTDVAVQLGQVVKGRETILARLK